MNYGRAFLGGVVGGAVMSVMMAMARLMGMQVNLEMMLGTMPGLQPGTTTWIIGLVMHLIASGIIALLYAVGFEYILHRAGWQAGLLLAIVHIVIAGIFMGMVPIMHPLVPEQLPAPGAFMSNKGVIGIVAFTMLHLIYGAIVGALYGPVRHQPAGATDIGRATHS